MAVVKLKAASIIGWENHGIPARLPLDIDPATTVGASCMECNLGGVNQDGLFRATSALDRRWVSSSKEAWFRKWECMPKDDGFDGADQEDSEVIL